MDNKYGYFDDRNREYVIVRPDTPLPWINYLGNKDYFSLISNTAGGYVFYQDARLRRISRYRYNNVPLDQSGRYIYIRDQSSGEFWSPTWQPTTKISLDHYQCRHGMGYTKIKSSYQGISSSTKYFIPLNQNLEIWDVIIKNESQEKKDLSIFSSIEFNLWDAWDDQTNYQRNLNIAEVEIENNVIYHKTEYRERRCHFSFFACSTEISGYDTQREEFLGPYHSWQDPITVVDGNLKNSHAHGWQPIGAHQVNISLKPGDSYRLIFLLGYHENPSDQKFSPPGTQILNKETVLPLIEQFTNPNIVDSSFLELRNYWDQLLSKLTVDTPNLHVNRMVNTWNAYQNMVTFNLSRSASYFESGIGRGMGFRDSNQDLLGFIHMVPERARQRLLDLAATQLATGGAFHQYQPLTKKGNDAIGTDFNDDPLWLILSVTSYIKETGDFTILEELVSYENISGTEETLLKHLERSIQYTRERLGPHNLPLIGRADWNDCLNLNCFSDTPGESFQTTTNRDGKTAESVFIAGLFVLACKEMAHLCDHHEDIHSRWDSSDYASFANIMEASVYHSGWDGEWFLRAYDYFGNKIGSIECEEGQLFIEPQGLCIMAGIGIDNGKADSALNAVEKKLATPHGIVLQQPAYSKYYLHIGEISSYPPGYKENAGIFCHTNPWIMIAETMLGRGEKALDYYLRINPSVRESISDVHRCEPFVYAQMIAGKDAPTHGEAKNSWLTGTAAYNYVAITQWILGVRPDYSGLRISPVVPDTWDKFKVFRIFRGTPYQIVFTRVGKGNSVKIEVDGDYIEGNVVPLFFNDGVKKKVQVSIGG